MAGFLIAGPVALAAQDPAQRALELERRDPVQAALLWRGILRDRPNDLQALLGLERALMPQGKQAEMLDQVRAAGRIDSGPAVSGLAIRIWTAARQPDSARVAALRWARQEPRSEAPFQEWGAAAGQARDLATARAAYRLGRGRLGPGTFAAELGRLAVFSGDPVEAAREWSAAVQTAPESRGAALGSLAQTPVASRTGLLAELSRTGREGTRLAAGLLVRWGEPRNAVRLVESHPDAWEGLLADLGRGPGGGHPEMSLARARLLELLAGQGSGSEANRYRLEAAQAYADGGDAETARRLLGAVARDSASLRGSSLAAVSAIISVLVEDGGIETADRRFRELAPELAREDRDRLAVRLAQGWIRSGRLGRADSLVAADSSIEALGLRGRIALYQGDLNTARSLLREAGPFAGDRASATQRIGVLGLLQVLDADSFPRLGAALYRLERGDSAGAAGDLEQLAEGLPPGRGGGELLLLAGQVSAAIRRPADAERLYRAALAHNVPASSAAAELALADLLLKQGRKNEAIAALEHLLLTWPTSAVVPAARRLLDVARGAVPAS